MPGKPSIGAERTPYIDCIEWELALYWVIARDQSADMGRTIEISSEHITLPWKIPGEGMVLTQAPLNPVECVPTVVDEFSIPNLQQPKWNSQDHSYERNIRRRDVGDILIERGQGDDDRALYNQKQVEGLDSLLPRDS